MSTSTILHMMRSMKVLHTMPPSMNLDEPKPIEPEQEPSKPEQEPIEPEQEPSKPEPETKPSNDAIQVSTSPPYVSDMSLFISHVSNYRGDEHVIPVEIEQRVTENVARVVESLEIGIITRIDLKVGKNTKTGAQYIDAFVHLYWFDTPIAVHTQSEIFFYGKTVWYMKGAFWVVRKNSNPMSQAEVELMKMLGATIREMLTEYHQLKPKVYWPELDQYITDIDTHIRTELDQNTFALTDQYGSRYAFMWLKHNRCRELTHRLRFHNKIGDSMAGFQSGDTPQTPHLRVYV